MSHTPPTQAGHSVLIFCGSKAHCERVAKHIAKHITVPERAKPATAAAATTDAAGDEESSGHIARAQLLTELSRIAAKPDANLQVVLPAGIAFHHSGLQLEEKKLVEQAFCTGWSGGVLLSAVFAVFACWCQGKGDVGDYSRGCAWLLQRGAALGGDLQGVLPAGIVFRHSGLQVEEDTLVEQAFCTGWSGWGGKGKTPVGIV